MNNRYNNLAINLRKELYQKKIEEKLISLKLEKEIINNKVDQFNELKQKNNALYYSNVIKRQNTHSPNHSVLLHEFVDDKKVTYQDITNKIDINELSSKVKNIIINTQRIKSNYKNKSNNNKPQIYHRKTKSSFSNRQSNSSFTTENESKNSFSVKNIFVNKNITYKNKQIQRHDTFLFNLNLNEFLNNKYNNIDNIENKTYENNKYYCKTLREYLNEQINNIKYKRNNINDSNLSNNNENENDHNYSIDNEKKDSFNKNENIKTIDDLFILSHTKNNKNIKNHENVINTLSDNKSQYICQIKSKKIDENFYCFNNNNKISNYLSFKQNKINFKNKNNKKSNTFRNSHIFNLTKQKTMKNLNSNIFDNNITIKKTQYNCNKLNKYDKYDKYILPKPIKIKTSINKNIIKINNNKIYKCFSMANFDNKDNQIINKENINTANICNLNNKIKNSQKELHKKKDNNKLLKYNDINKKNKVNKDKIHKKRKNYSEIIRNKMHSTSRKKIKVKIDNKKFASNK